MLERDGEAILAFAGWPGPCQRRDARSVDHDGRAGIAN
jgi:hypothetical protein